MDRKPPSMAFHGNVTSRILIPGIVMAIMGGSCTEGSHRTNPENHMHTSQTTSMASLIPSSIKAEHDELHIRLKAITELPGRTGEAARTVAHLLHDHFEKEEAYAMPPLGLLPALAKGASPSAKEEVMALSAQLERDMPNMLAEHARIVDALKALAEAAKAENQQEAVRFAVALEQHAHTEEEILYPAAILVGHYLRSKDR